MGKHSKNAGTMGCEALTYHERKALGFGTVQERMGKDSLGNFYDCKLTLTAANDPVCCPDGFLFSREAILENLLAQKKANKRKLAAWGAQQQELNQKAEDKSAIESEAALLAFDRQNHMGASEALASRLRETIAEEAEALLADKHCVTGVNNIGDNRDRMKSCKAFWLPSRTPEARTVLDKPDDATFCPASGKKLRLKDLVAVRLTPTPGGGPTDFMDPITRDPLTNASRLVLLKPTGDVVLKETYETCVKPEGSYGGVAVAPEDVLELQRGGTGFAAHDKQLQTKKFFALGPGSGMADRRGQHASASSKFGLSFNN